MTLLGPIFRPATDSLNDLPLEQSSLLGLFGSNSAGVTVSEEGSVGMTAVWRAVNLVAGTIASLPLKAYRRDGDTRETTGGGLADLLANPHEDLTQFEFWETVLTHMMLWGNAYAWIVRNGAGRAIHLRPIHPSTVKVARVHDERRRKVFQIDGKPHRWTEDDVLHLPGLGYDGIVGVSPIRAARQGVALGMAAEQFGAKLFGSGSLATGILQTDQRLTSEQAEALSERWEAKRAGLKSAHKTMILDRGAKFTQLSIPPEDAQFIETRKFQTTEIARLFGVPPHMLMDVEKSTSWGTGIEQQAIGFVVYTLRPWMTRIEQRMSRLSTPATTYARYSVEGLLRGDSKARSEFYKSMWELGALSTNEIRAKEEEPPVEGGDVRYRPLNFGELGTTDTNAQEATANE